MRFQLTVQLPTPASTLVQTPLRIPVQTPTTASRAITARVPASRKAAL